MRHDNLSLIGVPIDCTGSTAMCSSAPVTLRQLGLADAVAFVEDCNDLPVRISDNARDPASGVKGAAEVVRVTLVTKRVVEGVLRAGRKPVMLGGCCSYMVGALAAVRRVHGRIGLVYVDGHMDLYDGQSSPGGECADMPLAFAIGKGPALLDGAMEVPALVAIEDVSLLGYRDRYLAEPTGALMPEDLGPAFYHRDIEQVRKAGFGTTAAHTLDRQRANAGRYWLHLDWDVLDEAAMPSADYLMPGGCDWNELVELIRPLVQSPMMIGLSTACYNPDNDPDHADGRRVVDTMRRLFEQTGERTTR